MLSAKLKMVIRQSVNRLSRRGGGGHILKSKAGEKEIVEAEKIPRTGFSKRHGPIAFARGFRKANLAQGICLCNSS